MDTKNTYSNPTLEQSKTHNFLREFYYIFIGLFFLLLGLLNVFIKILPLEYSAYIGLLGFTSLTITPDLRKDIKVKSFLYIGLPFLFFIILILATGNGIWHGVLKLEMKSSIIFNLNDLFSDIPYNDASFARIFQPQWLTIYMKAVYNTGFVLAVIVPLYRATISIDFKKMLRYTLSAHVLQVFIITPFYFIFRLQEVWYVHGNVDTLSRNLTPSQTIETTLNCFPSMHTSISFAIFLLVLREKDKVFKYVWSFYCLSVIYSTMYLEIHWVIDIFGGLLLGYLTVKLVDYILEKASNKYKKRITNFFLKEQT